MNLSPHPYSLRQLQYAVAVADTLSFHRAAQLCRVSQPSLSAQLALLERQLGVRLFERDQRRVLLTSGGKALVERARALLVAADELLEAGRVLSDPLAGTLRLGLIPTIAPYLLPEVAPGLRKAFPKLHFAWVEEKTSELLERLGRADLDGAVLALLADLEPLPHIVLGKDPFVLAASQGHPLVSSGRALRPGDLEGERVFLLDDGHCFRDQALAFCTRVGAEEAGYRATSLSTLVQLTAGGAGVTLLPKMAVGVENRRASLRLRAFGESGPSRTVALVWRKGSALEPALEAVGKLLKSEYARLAAGWPNPER